MSFGLDRSFTHFHYQLEEIKGLELNAAFVSHSSARSLPWFLVRLQEEKFFRKLIYSVMRYCYYFSLYSAMGMVLKHAL